MKYKIIIKKKKTVKTKLENVTFAGTKDNRLINFKEKNWENYI